jgi:hypothetical protein
MTSEGSSQFLVASDQRPEMSTNYFHEDHHGFELHIEPSPEEACQAACVPQNPFADPIAPTPVHLSRPSNWPLQHFTGSSLTIASYDSPGSSSPSSRVSGHSSSNETLQRLAPSNENGFSAGKCHSQGVVWEKLTENSLPELLPKPKRRSKGFFTRIKDIIINHVHPQSILQLIDFRPWFWPITPKKYFVLSLIACAIAGIIISNFYFHWIEKSLAITMSFMLPVLIISVCAEPLVIMIILLVAKIPDIPKAEIDMIMNWKDADVEAGTSVERKEPEGPFETALIIPCHNTDEAAMKTTLDSAFPKFRPQDIFIVDNGRSRYPKHPTCNFRAYIKSIHPDIVYIWSPIGSKNVAQFVGALAAKDYKYIMTVDDDVCIPKNFHPPTEMINDKFKAVAYPLKAMDADCNVPLWVTAWQDVEYRLSGLSKLAEDRLCGVQYPHGAGWYVHRRSNEAVNSIY